MSYFAPKATLEPVRPTTPLRSDKGKARAASSQFVIDDDTDVPVGTDPLTATATDAEADPEAWPSPAKRDEDARSILTAPQPNSPAASRSLRGLLSSTSSFFDSPRPAKSLTVPEDADGRDQRDTDGLEAGKARGLEQTLDRIGFGAYQWRLLVSETSSAQGIHGHNTASLVLVRHGMDV